jgi:serine/threonine protein kinase
MAIPRLASFMEQLRGSDLLQPAQLEEISRGPHVEGDDPRPLAKELIQRGWLTRFQINQIGLGKGTELVVGPYRLVDKLGEGAMGQVFKAHHVPMNRTVALKVIRKERLANPDAVRRFYREVQAAAQLVHPNIVLAYDAGQAGTIHYFAMEYVEGSDLARLVKEHGPLPIAQACDYIRQAALGLQHAHERGLVHRDIKPHNLLVTHASSKAVVKILDMGLARFQGLTGPEHALTQSGAVIGTPDFIAPEQALKAAAADIRSDLYSLGCTLHYLLTGQAPHQGASLTEILLKHQLEAALPAQQQRPDTPDDLQAILNRLMAKRPEERFQTPAEVADALAPFCQPGATASKRVLRHRPADRNEEETEWSFSEALPGNRNLTRTASLAQTDRTAWLSQALARKKHGASQAGSVIRTWLVAGAIVLATAIALIALMLLLTGNDRRNEPDRDAVANSKAAKQPPKPPKNAEGARPQPAPAPAPRKPREAEPQPANPPNPPAPAVLPEGLAAAHRQAATWALKLGGRVHVRGGRELAGPAFVAALPREDFVIDTIRFDPQLKIPDTDLQPLRGLARLTSLDLSGIEVADASLRHLQDLPDLERLTLPPTVGNEGIKHLKDLTSLQFLFLASTRVTDSGLEHLTGLTNLMSLNLNETAVSDKGLAWLGRLPQLKIIELRHALITDAGMEHLKGLTTLEALHLTATRVRGPGLAFLPEASLKDLWLDQTRVTREGLQLVGRFPNLTALHLENLNISDADLGFLKGLGDLRVLYLNDNPLTDKGLHNLEGLTRLNFLTLSGAGITNAGLDALKTLPELQGLVFYRSRITDAAVQQFKEFPRLNSLFLWQTPFTQAGVLRMKEERPHCRVTAR